MLYQVVPEKSPIVFDVDTTLYLMKNVYHYRGLDDPTVYRDEVATTLVVGVVQAALEMADQLVRSGDTSTAVEVLDLQINNVPEYWQPYTLKSEYLGLREQDADSLINSYIDYLDLLLDHNADNVYYHLYRGMALQHQGRFEEATLAYRNAYEINRCLQITYRTLLGAYLMTRRMEEAKEISREFLEVNPYDPTAQSIISGNF
jgi:tetratricopeptide (TPR) repeat protein